jgi:hypothetical protein
VAVGREENKQGKGVREEDKEGESGWKGQQREEKEKRTISFLVADDTLPASMKRSQAANHSSVVI